MNQHTSTSFWQLSLCLFFLLLLLANCNSSSLSRGHFIPVAKEPVELDFEMESELMVFSAEVNGISGRFIFDNGFSLSGVNADFAQKANIRFRRSSNLTDANNKSAATPETSVDTVRIQGQVFAGTGFYQIDTKKFFPCTPVDGIIGASVINKANWEIDFVRKQLRISSQPFQREGMELMISFSSNNSSFVELDILETPVKIKVDFGSTRALKIHDNLLAPALAGAQVEKRVGIISLSAQGLGNIDSFYLAARKVPLTHAGQELPLKGEVLLSPDLKYQGYIGIDYFKDYKVIINSEKRQYILSDPQVEALTDTLEHTYGIALYLMEDQWKVIQFNPNDPLMKNIHLMDEVSSLNGQPISRFQDICAYKAWLKQKTEARETIRIQMKNSAPPLDLPFREPVLSVFSP